MPYNSTGWIEWWGNAINITTILLKNLGKELAKRRRIFNTTLKAKLIKISIKLKRKPFYHELQDQVVAIRYKVKKVDVYELKGAQLKSRFH